MLARLPLISHSAWSTPLMALYKTGPLRQYELTYIVCQTSSMWSGFLPFKNGRRNSSTAVTTALARWVNVAQP